MAAETVLKSQSFCSDYVPCQSCEMTSDISRTSRMDYLAANLPEVDFALILARTIDSIKTDPSQLRNTVYELARSKLLREASERRQPISILALPRLMLAFETAIERVERQASRQDELRALRSIGQLISPADRENGPKRDQRDPVLILDQTARATEARVIANFSAPAKRVSLFPKRKRNWPGAAAVLRVGTIAILMMALCVIINKYDAPSGLKTPSGLSASTHAIQKSDTQEATLVPRLQSPVVQRQPQLSALPLPSVYGIYAVSNGELYELEALPGRVPDPRVFMSTPVKTPSRAMLPDGRIAFILFRRDMTMNAPDRVAVRVIAKVMRGMTFNTAGRASTTSLDDQWAIRSTSYDLRVAPLSDNPEMLLLRLENTDFVFPAGRYGLVLKGQAFDFSVVGPITEPAQCLERVAAANGTFYSECRSP
jgi:hypothetical protein